MHTSTVLSVAILLIPNLVTAHGAPDAHPHQLYQRATTNGPCTGAGGHPGVCISTADCTADGGTHILNACPGLPDNIRCCTKASTLTGLCPGPTDFKCCLPGTSPSGGFPAPRIPGVGACKAIAVSGAQKVVNALPGRVREIFCIRDCACSSSSSEHCCGKAIDYMCTSGGGVRNDAGTANGLAIRNWVQANAGALNVKYIIWGQQIWSPARAGEGWRNMEDRGSITANHWYGLPRISLLYRSFLA
ncbi:MAG: hypothetical protein LQ348_002915 [Seirophora lacunosa]|nr:MAG: hypothetical protein LQ348_002915 [Seirophora lacunosa]